MLKSLESQSYSPDQVIIVDGGLQRVEGITEEFHTLKIKYLRCIPPSATKQRNMGIKAVDPEITLIGFLDDDVVLEANALKEMMSFWESAPENIGGAAFNIVNYPPLYASWLKSTPLVEKLGLYSKERGIVLLSGFQTMIGFVSETTLVEYLPTTAFVGRRDIFEEFKFDEWFSGYSYLEDLDFIYRVNKKYRLAVVADARCCHYSLSSGRESSFSFGIKEVANRIYFVKKHNELSLFKCFLAVFMRMIISLSLAIQERKFSYLQRVWGNIVGLLQAILR